MIAALLPPILSAVLSTSAAGLSLPTVAIDRICRADATGDTSPKTLETCRRDERAAREDLMRRWASLPARQKAACTGTALSVSPSYVDIKGCIDTNAELERERHLPPPP